MARADRNETNPQSNGSAGKLPPQDLEAERAVLASMLLHAPCIDEVMQVLSADKFYASAHRQIFTVVSQMWDKGNWAIDAITVSKELEKAGLLAEIGGTPYLVTVMETVPHAAHAVYYAGIVRDAWIRRELMDVCTDSLRDVFSPGIETDDLSARVEQRLHALMEAGTPTKSTSIVDSLAEVFDEQLKERRQGIPTGFADFDKIIDGMMPGTLTILAARPSMGKTALALNVIRNVARDGRRVLLISMEQPQLEIAERLLALESEVSIHTMRAGGLSESENYALTEGSNRLGPLPIEIDERMGQTPTKLASLSRLHKRRNGLGLLVIDYLQLLEPDDQRQPREQQVATATRRLKGLARDLDVPVLLLAQLNRQVENREDKAPRLSDIRESGAIEQDADQVWFIWRRDVYDPDDSPGEAFVRVAKNRNGPLGTVKFYFRAPYFRFDPAAGDWQVDDFADKQDKYTWGYSPE